MAGSRDDLLKEFDDSYNEFRTVLEDVDDGDFEKVWLDGRWRVREITAHVTGWLGQLGAGMERMARGERPSQDGETPWTEVDTWNDVFADHAQGKRKEQVLKELEAAASSFKVAAMKLPDERFGEGKTATQMFQAAGAPHFREHAEMIREWRAGLGS
jgi:Protein of unknown function (DUF1706)